MYILFDSGTLVYWTQLSTTFETSAQRVGFCNIGWGRVLDKIPDSGSGSCQVGVSKYTIEYFRVSFLLSGISGYLFYSRVFPGISGISGYVGYHTVSLLLGECLFHASRISGDFWVLSFQAIFGGLSMCDARVSVSVVSWSPPPTDVPSDLHFSNKRFLDVQLI